MLKLAAVSPRRTFFVLLGITLLFRFWLAAAMPITGDEAYFIWWGQIPDWGFYDHPPMIGWWLAALLKVSSSAWWLRLPAIVQPGVLGIAVAACLHRRLPQIAWWAALLVLLAPVNVWNVFITTDTPLVYFSVAAGLAWLNARRAEDEERSPWGWYTVAGVALAGAVLSKYFVALLGFAFLLDTLWRPSKRKFGGLLWVYALVLPALALMAWWNAANCWPNIMFNFYNRHAKAGWSWHTPLLYFGMLLYMLTPVAAWLLLRQRSVLAALAGRRGNENEGRALLVLALAPLALFAGLSLVKQIGLHWVLSFIPFVLMLLATGLDVLHLRRLTKFFVGFAALHLVAIVTISLLPMETWQRTRLYDGIVLTFEAPKLLDELKAYEDYTWMMDGYSNAVTLGYNTYARSQDGQPRYVGVFGEASSHARHDDILTDFRLLDGKNILILRKIAPGESEYAPYFREVEQKHITVRGTTFYLILGRGFNYAEYRERVLRPVKQKYYGIPKFLPQTACYFGDRYFPGEPCQR